MIDLRDPLIALDFDGAAIRAAWQHEQRQAGSAAPASDKPVITPNWDVRTVIQR